MSFGQTEIYNALNQADITGLLDTFKIGTTTHRALFADPVIPTIFTGNKSINFYRLSPSNMANNYGEYIYTANCRAQTQGESIAIAKAVIDKINRANFPDCFITCSVGVLLSPMDETDNYNCPVEITLKKRSI